jgi:hypothetical protein
MVRKEFDNDVALVCMKCGARNGGYFCHDRRVPLLSHFL